MLKKLTILLLLVMAAVFALDHLLYFGLSHNLNLKASYVGQGKVRAEALVLGPCEPLFTIDPDYLEKKLSCPVYNLSLNHSDFADNYLHFYLFLKSNPAPKMLLLYVTPESFDLRFNTFHAYRFAPFLADSIVSATIGELDSNYAPWIRLPLLRYTYFGRMLLFPALQGLKHWNSGKQKPYLSKGYEQHRPAVSPFFDPARKSDSLLFDVQLDEFGNTPEDAADKTFIWNATREKYFVKIMDLARTKGVQVIVYESPGFSGILRTQRNRLAFLQKIDSLCNSKGSAYWCFDHLATCGARANFISPLMMKSAASQNFMDTLSLRINKLK